jgi:cyclic pyranopterin phosphate synthase
MSQLTDGFGRSFPYLRLSLTEACNFRCSYCLPDGYQADGRPRFLQVDEIARLVRAFAALGMSKIRLTGGEPSLRKDLDEIIATVAAVPGIRKVAITTNGTLLPRRLPGWHRAGLTALNVSMDSLQRERFTPSPGTTACRRSSRAWPGAGAGPAGDQAQRGAAAWPERRRAAAVDGLPARPPFSVRFIELMRTGDNEAYFQRHHLRADVVIEQLLAAGWHERRARPMPARRASSATPTIAAASASSPRIRVTSARAATACG